LYPPLIISGSTGNLSRARDIFLLDHAHDLPWLPEDLASVGASWPADYAGHPMGS